MSEVPTLPLNNVKDNRSSDDSVLSPKSPSKLQLQAAKSRSRSSSVLVMSDPKHSTRSDEVTKSPSFLSSSSSHVRRERSSSSSILRETSLENSRSQESLKIKMRDASPLKSIGESSGLREHNQLDLKSLKISISSSVPVHSSTEKEFTAFLVTITFPNGEQKTMLRRYRQFAALHHSIQKAYPDILTPRFPKKRLIGNMGQHVIEKRRKKLEAYLRFAITIPDVEELLGFETFLGADLMQRGRKHKKGTSQVLEPGLEDFYRIAQDRRFNEVKVFVLRLDGCIEKLRAIEKAFESVHDTSDFVKLSDFSKLVVILGKQLGGRPNKDGFEPKQLTSEQEEKILNPKIKSIRKKIVPAISEIQAKLIDIKEHLLDVNYPMEKVLDLEHIVDDIQEIFDNSHLIPKSLGFRIEGGSTDNEIEQEIYPTYFEDNIYWYKKYFVGRDHLVCYANTSLGDYVIAIKDEKLTETTGEFRLMLCTKDGNESAVTKLSMSKPSLWKEKYQDIITHADLRLRGVEWNVCPGIDVESFIVDHEAKDMRVTRKLKFGILLCLKNQVKEEDMFNNQEEIQPFKEFLDYMGERVELSSYTGFPGGLDTRGTNTTGTHSLVSSFKGPDESDFSIMYHVSTMLPHGEQDQQLAKKRHIGNDIVLVVFQEDGSLPYSPTTVKSNYIQITIVVRAIYIGDDKYAWRVTVCSAQDVPVFGPPLPYPPIFDDGKKLSEWLHAKMVSAELASYKSKLFIQQLRSTYKTLVGDLISKLPQTKKKKARSYSKKK